MAKTKKVTRKRYSVDVLTPIFGSPEFIEPLAQSLLHDVDAGVSFHWILIDDNTPEDRDKKEVLSILRELDTHEGVTVVYNKVNGGFSKANNFAFRKGRAPLVLMLNSDILIKEDGWMAAMTANFDNNPLVSVVGARLLYFEKEHIKSLCDKYPDKATKIREKVRDRPPGTVQHAGVVFNVYGQPYHAFMGWPADHSKAMERRMMKAVTGACLMTRRKLWKQMGGMPEVYQQGNFEDVEYCVRLASMGHAIIYEPAACLYHYAGGSDNVDLAVKNQTIFQLRCKHLLTYDAWVHY